MNYIHLTQEERCQIYALLREGFSKYYIAPRLSRLNHRPRKRLGFRSPSQVLFQEHGVASHTNLTILNTKLEAFWEYNLS